MIMLLSPSKNMKDCVYDDANHNQHLLMKRSLLLNELNKMNAF